MREFEICTNAQLQNEALCRVIVAAFLIPYHIEEEELMEVKTIVSEAICNAIIHGSESERDSFVFRMRLIGNELQIEVQDFGKGIADVELAMTPLYTTKSEEERSGMGFTIMQTFADDLWIENKVGEGVTLHVWKVLNLNAE